MKTRLFLLLLSISWLSGGAQNSQMEYRPFAQDGKLWEYQVGLIYDNVYDNYVNGATLIIDETYIDGSFLQPDPGSMIVLNNGARILKPFEIPIGVELIINEGAIE